jgi:hypothetical protein
MPYLAELPCPPAKTSPLVICDRLLTLAQDADRAGYVATAERLLRLAHIVLDEKRLAA